MIYAHIGHFKPIRLAQCSVLLFQHNSFCYWPTGLEVMEAWVKMQPKGTKMPPNSTIRWQKHY